MTISNFALCGIAIAVLLMCWKWTRSHPDFDLSDLLTGENGRVSASKFMQTGGWTVGTWGFVTLIQEGKMSEWYFTGYMALCFGVRIAKDALTKPDAPK